MVHSADQWDFTPGGDRARNVEQLTWPAADVLVCA